MASSIDPSCRVVKPPQSILGALFSSAASALKGSISPLESSTSSVDSTPDQLHTRSLLFPDSNPNDFKTASTASDLGASNRSGTSVSLAYDYQTRVDLQSPRDVRIIIAQDASGSRSKTVLFDSKAAVPRPPQPDHHARHPDLTILRTDAGIGRSQLQPGGQVQNPTDLYSNATENVGGAFNRPRRRGLNGVFPVEIGPKWYNSEPVGDMRLLLDCIFGTTPLSYRGDTTKLHVLPADDAGTRSSTTSPIVRENSGSWGKSEGRRRSQLSHSFTPSDVGGADGAPSAPTNTVLRETGTRTVLLTRSFAVNLSDVPEPSPNDKEGVASKQRLDRGSSTPKSRQRKTPMYAVAIALQIPASDDMPTQKAGPRQIEIASDADRSSSRGPPGSASTPEPETGSLFFDAAFGLPSLLTSRTCSGDVDDYRIDIVMQHFDVVARVLSYLQETVRGIIHDALQQAWTNSANILPQHLPPAGRYIDERGREANGPERVLTKNRKQILVQLEPGVLASNEHVRAETERAGIRLATGLRIPRVVTGQRRWALWQEEARWIERWGGGKEHNFFFYRLLTAFLGNHTFWLNTIEQLQHRPRKWPHHDDCIITERTVMVGSNKLASRRLLFLLATFLPAQGSTLGWGLTGYDGEQYGPAGAPILPSTVRDLTSREIIQGDQPPVEDIDHQQGDHRDRSRHIEFAKVNDSEPSRGPKTGSLPIPSGNAGRRKSSATTTATLTPATTTLHASISRRSHDPGTQTGSRTAGSSLASTNLVQALKRNDITEQSHSSTDTQPATRWGSLVSGFWSHRRGSSTDPSEVMVSPEEGPTMSRKGSAINIGGGSGGDGGSGGKFAQMVEQADQLTSTTVRSIMEPSMRVRRDREAQPKISTPESRDEQHLHPRRGHYHQVVMSPDPINSLDSPLKLSVDERDGVVDVEFHLPNFSSSSFGSSARSPSTSIFNSTGSFDDGGSGLGRLTQHSLSITGSFPAPAATAAGITPIDQDDDAFINVAGWLRRFHPDFTLQAVHSYTQLVEHVKQAMRTEPISDTIRTSSVVSSDDNDGDDFTNVNKNEEQMHEDDDGGRWRVVCSTIIADTDSFTVKRLSLLRRVQLSSRSALNDDSSDTITNTTTITVTATTGDQEEEKEKFIEETVFDMDDILIDAVERIISSSIGGTSVTRLPSTAGINKDATSVATPANGVPAASSSSTEAITKPMTAATGSSIATATRSRHHSRRPHPTKKKKKERNEKTVSTGTDGVDRYDTRTYIDDDDDADSENDPERIIHAALDKVVNEVITSTRGRHHHRHRGDHHRNKHRRQRQQENQQPDEQEQGDDGGDGGKNSNHRRRKERGGVKFKENSLRDGIYRWLISSSP